MRARLVVASGLATVLATGSTALAAPPWSAPEDISAPVEQVNRTSIDFGADGVALISSAEGCQQRRRAVPRPRDPVLGVVSPTGTARTMAGSRRASMPLWRCSAAIGPLSCGCVRA